MTEITVTIWHNVRTDPGGRHLAMLDGYTPGDPMVRVFTYQAQPRGRTPEQLADRAFSAFNGYPSTPATPPCPAPTTSGSSGPFLSGGDVVAVGEAGLAVAKAGWARVRGGLTEVCTDEHSTHPLPGQMTRRA